MWSRYLCLAASLVLAVTLAGCASPSSTGNGVASKTPAQIVAIAKSAAAGAATVHVAGSIVSEGKPISINMELVAHKGGAGRIALGGGLEIELVDVDRTLYIDASAAFYGHFVGSTAARLLQGKWLKGSAEHGALASFASLTDLGKLIDGTLDIHGTLSYAGGTTIDGQKAVAVRDLIEDGTLYVAATGTPYPLEIIKDGTGAGKLVFDKWNQPVTLEAPADAIDINQLQSGR
jgi:hypothetical protein